MDYLQYNRPGTSAYPAITAFTINPAPSPNLSQHVPASGIPIPAYFQQALGTVPPAHPQLGVIAGGVATNPATAMFTSESMTQQQQSRSIYNSNRSSNTTCNPIGFEGVVPGDNGSSSSASAIVPGPAVLAPRQKTHLRKAAAEVWSDPTLDDWPDDDFRVFCGDLGNEVTDELLSNAFRHIKSFQRARVIRDKRTGKGKGFGFVSFSSPEDMLRALKEMDRKYVGNRPIRVLKSKWKDRC